jgi:transposase
MADQRLKVRGVSLEAVDVAPTAENPAKCVTDKGHHSRAVLKALDDSLWKTRISEPKQIAFSRWRGDEAARRAVTNNRVRLKSGVAHAAFKLRAEIEGRNPQKRIIHVIWDNAAYHKGPDVRAFLARITCRIRLIQLPPYCPHLNPIERLWAVLHRYVTHNRYYRSQKQFADAILAFMRQTIPREWKSFRDTVSDKFRVMTHEKFRVLE